MDILDRNPNPDQYSIKEIKIGFERHEGWDSERKRHSGEFFVELYLLVSLEPKRYMRQRFTNGRSYRAKKNPCRLVIRLSELQEMEQALRDKLENAYQFLNDRDLLSAFVKGASKGDESPGASAA